MHGTTLVAYILYRPLITCNVGFTYCHTFTLIFSVPAVTHELSSQYHPLLGSHHILTRFSFIICYSLNQRFNIQLYRYINIFFNTCQHKQSRAFIREHNFVVKFLIILLFFIKNMVYLN